MFFMTPLFAQETTFHEILRFGRGFPRSIAWHPGGKIILVNTATDAWLYAADTFDTLAHFEDVNWSRFSADGRWLIGATQTGETVLRDMTTFEAVRLPNGFQNASLSPDSRWLMGTDSTQHPILSDTTTFEPIPLPNEYSNRPFTSTWSTDSTRLAAIDDNGILSVWRVGAPDVEWEVETGAPGYAHWSPDDSKLYKRDDQNRVQIWNADTGELLTDIPAQVNDTYEQSYGWVTWTPDSRRIIRFFPSNDSVTLQVVEASTGQEVTELKGYQVFYLSFSPDGAYMALNDSLYETGSFRKITDIYAFQLAWSPDSSALAYAGDISPRIDVFDMATHRIAQTVQDATRNLSIRQIAWSPDSAKLAGWDDDGVIIVWDVVSGQEIGRLEAHIPSAQHAAFSSDGRWIAVADAVGNVRVWDTQTGELLATLEGHVNEVDVLAWQPNGRLLATKTMSDFLQNTGDRTIVNVWNAVSGQLVGTIDHDQDITDVSWYADGSTLVTASNSELGTVQLWDSDTHIVMRQDEGFSYMSFPEIHWSPNGHLITMEYSYATHGGQALKVWDADMGEVLAEAIHFHGSQRYTWNEAGTEILLASAGCTYRAPRPFCGVRMRTIFDAAQPPLQTVVESYQLASSRLGAFTGSPNVVWSPNGRYLAAVAGSLLKVWEVEAGNLILIQENVRQVEWRYDSGQLLILRPGNSLDIFDLATDATILTVERVEYGVWNPVGTIIVGRDENSVFHLWDAITGESLVTLQGNQVVWSPDGSQFAELFAGTFTVWAQ